MCHRICSIVLLLLLAVGPVAAGPFDKTRAGQQAPEFQVTTTDGKTWNLKDMRGKVVVLNFFATWCPPCRQELPHLQSELWNKRKSDSRWTMLSVGREHTVEQLKAFQEKEKFTFPMAADPERGAYSLYAEKMIPRTYVIDPKGKIVFQSIGFEEGDLGRIEAAIEGALK